MTDHELQQLRELGRVYLRKPVLVAAIEDAVKRIGLQGSDVELTPLPGRVLLVEVIT